MSTTETPLTRRYWKTVGGTLIEEFPAVRAGPENGLRLLDGVIILGGPFEIQLADSVEITGMWQRGPAEFCDWEHERTTW